MGLEQGSWLKWMIPASSSGSFHPLSCVDWRFLLHFQCNVFSILHDDSWSGRVKSFFSTMQSTFMFMIEHSYVSSTGVLVLISLSYSFVPTKLSRKWRAIIGILHVCAHMVAALMLMLLLELAVDMCIRNRLLATSGGHSLLRFFYFLLVVDFIITLHFMEAKWLQAIVRWWPIVSIKIHFYELNPIFFTLFLC